jgi:hypothetical protein
MRDANVAYASCRSSNAAFRALSKVIGRLAAATSPSTIEAVSIPEINPLTPLLM